MADEDAPNDLTLCDAIEQRRPLEVIRAIVQSRPRELEERSKKTGNWPLHQAILLGLPPGVIGFLARQWEPALRRRNHPQGWLPLHLAAQYSPQAVVCAIFQLYPEAIEEKTMKGGDLPLHLVKGNPDEMNVVRFLTFEWPMALHEVNYKGWLPMHAAAAFMSLEAVAFCADQWGEALQRRTIRGELPLHVAASHRAKYVVDPTWVIRLLAARWPPALEAQDEDGFLPMHHAAQFSTRQVVEALAELSKKAIQTTTIEGALPLHLATMNKHDMEAVVTYLVARDPQALQGKDATGCLPIHYAVNTQNAAGILLLAKLSPEGMQHRSDDGFLPLQLAICKGSPIHVVKALMEAFPEAVQAKDRRGRTALHLAVECQAPFGVVRFLVNNCRGGWLELFPEVIGNPALQLHAAQYFASVARSQADAVAWSGVIPHLVRLGSSPNYETKGLAVQALVAGNRKSARFCTLHTEAKEACKLKMQPERSNDLANDLEQRVGVVQHPSTSSSNSARSSPPGPAALSHRHDEQEVCQNPLLEAPQNKQVASSPNNKAPPPPPHRTGGGGGGSGGEGCDSSPPPLVLPSSPSRAHRRKKNKRKKKKPQRGNVVGNDNIQFDVQESDGTDDMPGLISAAGLEPDQRTEGAAAAAAAAASNDSNGDVDDLPELAARGTEDANLLVEGRRKARYQEERHKAMKLRFGDLKRSLRERGIQLHHGMEMLELTRLHAQAVIDTEFLHDETLHRAQPASTAASTASSRPESDLPPLILAKPVPRNGCWVLAPVRAAAAEMELLYAVVQDGAILFDRVPVRIFRGGSHLIPCRSGTRAYVCEPHEGAVTPTWEVRLVSSHGGNCIPPIPLCRLPFDPLRTDLLANPRTNDIWAVTKKGSDSWKLFVTTFRDLSRPVEILALTNPGVRLVAVDDSGAWLHYEGSRSGAGPGSSTVPGLWYVPIDPVWKPGPPDLLYGGEVGEGAHVSPTLDGGGLWALSRRDEKNGAAVARCVLSMKSVESVGEEGTEKRVTSTSKTLNIQFERVLAVVAARDGVFVHCKPPIEGDSTKLMFACLESNAVVDVVDCPRSWNLHAADEGCWLWKKVGGGGSRAPRERALSFVVATDFSVVDSARKFPAGSIIPAKAATTP